MPMNTLIRRLTTGVITLAASALLGVSAVAAELPTIKLGTVAWVGYAPFYVAADKSFFDKHGVKVELQDFPDPALMPTALESDSIQGTMYTYDQVITSVANGRKHRVVMPIDYSNGADAIVADKSIKTIADLKGKQVAYPFATCDNLMVVYALNQAGLSEKDVLGVDTTPENVAPAMMSGAVAGATYEPNVSQVLKLGGGDKFKVLYTSKEAPGLITDVLYFKDDYLKANPTIIKAVIAGYLEGLSFIKSNSDEAFAIIGKHMGVTAAEAKAQYPGAYNIPSAEMAQYFVQRDDFKSLFKVGKMISELLVARAQIKAAPAIPDTFDASFVAALGSK